MILRKIPLSLNPYDYSSIIYKNREDAQTFAGLILRRHTLDGYGRPCVPNIGDFHKQSRIQSAVNRVTSQIFAINGATQILFQSDIVQVRENVNKEIAMFGNLGAGEEERHKKTVEREKEEKAYQNKEPEAPAIEDKKGKLERGENLKKSTPEEIAARTAGFNFMAAKRRAFSQAVKISPHINTFGFAGLLMAGPKIYIPWALTPDRMGLNSPLKQVRKSSIDILRLDLQITMQEFDRATNGPKDDSTFLLFNYNDGISSIGSIIDALSLEGCGTDDPDSEIKAKAKDLKDDAIASEERLHAKIGTKPNSSSSIILSN